MKIAAFITSYDRPEMLQNVVNHLRGQGIEPLIFLDGVTEHRGKKGFWKTWNEILQAAEKIEADIYLFMPDDFEDIDIDRIKYLHTKLKRPYAFNIINDGRTKCWVNKACVDMGQYYSVGFVDCGFFCGRDTLDKLGYWMNPPYKAWWQQSENISSGVGMMLSKRLYNAGVRCYKPKYSLAKHGDHESKMHPQERQQTPLKSI